jgi:hypothetical protein
MRFVLFLTGIESRWTEGPPDVGEQVYQAYMEVERQLEKAGVPFQSLRLRFSDEAVTLRNASGERPPPSRGAFAKTPDSIGGLYILECASMDDALAWAKRMPNYGHGAIEVRPIGD